MTTWKVRLAQVFFYFKRGRVVFDERQTAIILEKGRPLQEKQRPSSNEIAVIVLDCYNFSEDRSHHFCGDHKNPDIKRVIRGLNFSTTDYFKVPNSPTVIFGYKKYAIDPAALLPVDNIREKTDEY